MRARHFTLSLAVLALLLEACATKDYGTSSSFDPLTRFPAAATFNWDPRGSSVPDDPRLAGLELAELLRDVLGSELAAKAYTDAQGGPASYRVTYRLDVKTWIGVDKSQAIASLSVDLNEAASGRKVWSGFARAPIHVDLPDAERRERVRVVIEDMLKDFPPQRR